MVQIPAAGISVLLLGPGTRVTHRAMELMGDTGVGAVWVGEHGVRYYAHGRPLTTHVPDAVATGRTGDQHPEAPGCGTQDVPAAFPGGRCFQADHAAAARPGSSRVRQVYCKASKDTGVPWSGRLYRPEDFASGDAVNQALSAGHACLYGLAHA